MARRSHGRNGNEMMTRIGLTVVLTTLLGAGAVPAEPIKVRLPEGSTRGFLVVRPPGGEPIAYGELVQKPARGALESRMLLKFADGSVYDETATFSQRDVFRLEAYKLFQGGPSFPGSAIEFDRKSGRYQARIREEKGGEEKMASGALEMPLDLYNGMAMMLLKNLPAGSSASTQMAAFTPAPRLIKMILGPEGDDAVLVGPETKRATRYLVKLEVGGLTGVIATLIGKDPPDLRYWLISGDVPAFARFEGSMYLKGPVWQLEMTPLEWPR
jgi:hypothetical protein